MPGWRKIRIWMNNTLSAHASKTSGRFVQKADSAAALVIERFIITLVLVNVLFEILMTEKSLDMKAFGILFSSASLDRLTATISELLPCL